MPLRAIGQAFDPMVRLLAAAIVLASILPVTGEGRAVAQSVSEAAIFLLFLLNGLRLPRAEVLRGLGHWPFLLPLALWCFGAMALFGWMEWRFASQWLPASVALGLLYLGTLPSTVQSATAYSSLAGGNVASSVVAAALLNILGVFLTAPIFAALAGGEAVSLGWTGLQKIALILLLPFAIGQALQGRLGAFVAEKRRLLTWADRTAIAIAVYVAFSAAVEQGIWQRIDAEAWVILLGCVAAFLAFAFGGAWFLGGVLGLARGDRVAMLFAGGQKSIAMGAPLATILFPAEQAGLVLLPVLTYHLLQLALSAPIANRLARQHR
jgi:sodium/bile acid cotransporter 7